MLDFILASGNMHEKMSRIAFSNLLHKTISLVIASNSKLEDSSNYLGSKKSRSQIDISMAWQGPVVQIGENDCEDAVFNIHALVNPVTETAQKISNIVQVLRKISGTCIKVYLNPAGKLTEIPIKRFYQFVLAAEPDFNEKG